MRTRKPRLVPPAAVFCVVTALFAGCGDGVEADAAAAERSAAPSAGTPAQAGDELDDLAALGYSGYDEQPTSARSALGPASPGPPDPGPLLLTDERDRVLLVDRDGSELWSLRVPGRSAVELAEPLPGGRVATLAVDEGVDIFGPDGTPLASWDLDCHHDLALEPGGTLLVAVHREQPYRGRRVRFDQLVRIDPRQPELAPEPVWDSYEQRAGLIELGGVSPLDRPREPGAPPGGHTLYDRFHLNSVAVLPLTDLGSKDARFAAGNLLLCLRNASLLLVLEPAGGAITWSYGPGELDFPHHPTLLASGRVLVFDNGFHRDWSRLLELAPERASSGTEAARIAWDWRADEPADFHSKTRGAVQRLAAGHTLATDSESGRVFELDAAGRVAWQWLRPLEPNGSRRLIYRAVRPSDAWVAMLLGR